MKRFGTSEQQLHVEVYPQENLHPQLRKSTVLSGYPYHNMVNMSRIEGKKFDTLK